MGQPGAAGPPGPAGPRGEPGPRGLPGGTGLSPDLIARIARLEEFITAARPQGGFAGAQAAHPHAATMIHVADVGSGGGAGAGSAVGSPRPSAETGRTAENGPTVETARPLAGRVADAGRSAMPAGMTTGRAAQTVRPLEAGRTATERSRMMESRDPNGSPRRRADQGHLHEVDYTVHSDTEARPNGPSSGWLWALPLAALAGLGLYFLGGERDDRTPVTASRDIIQPAADGVATMADLKERTVNAIQSLTTAMQGVKDASSATAAMPRIQDTSREVERLAMQVAQLPASDRTALADATREQTATLNTAIDGVTGLPGVGSQLQQMTSVLRGRMDAIAMVPGKPLFMTGAPSEWVLLSSVQDREVLNRAGERLGTANGFFIGPDGTLVASLVSVDRQLGIGDRQIGLSFTGGQLERKADGWHLVVDTSKDDVQRAKVFESGK
jgi:PRC-barrel domain